jgi:hypothetical protein
MRFLRPRVDAISRSQPPRRPALALALAALGLLLASHVRAENSAIRIGAPLPLTGALSPEGLKLQQGYELWKEVVNAAGGINVGGTGAVSNVVGIARRGPPIKEGYRIMRRGQLADLDVRQACASLPPCACGSGRKQAVPRTAWQRCWPTAARFAF